MQVNKSHPNKWDLNYIYIKIKFTYLFFTLHIKIDNCALSGNPGNEPKSSKYSITFCDKPAFCLNLL